MGTDHKRLYKIMDVKDWAKKQRITVGMKSADAGRALEEWLHRAAPCDLHVRRAKTKGWICFVVDTVPEKEPDGVYWLSWCVQHFDCKADIKEL